MSEWNEIDADWDLYGYASQKLLALGESELWLDLAQEVAASTHATADEAWEGMAAGMRGYLESLDGGANGAENLPEPPDFEEKPQKTPLKAQGIARNDSREKLEEDVRKNYAYSTTTLMYPPSANKTTDMLGAMPIDTVIGWLDRQAAITEKECCKPLKERIAELEAQLADAREALDAAWSRQDELKAERDTWKDAFEDSERMRLALVDDLGKRDMGIERLKRRRGELMEQVRSLQDELARVRREG